MDIAEKVLRQKQDFDDVYEAGKKAEYDEFWDEYQDYGKETSYSGAFAGQRWTATTFKPKYDIYPSQAQNIFWNSRIDADLVEYLNSNGVKLDTSNSTNNSAMFEYSNFTRVGVIDFTKANSSYSTFAHSRKLITIDKIVYHEKLILTTAFIECYELVNLIIEGTIGQNGFDIHWSTKLSATSLYSIITALSPTFEGTIILPTTAETNYNANPPAGAPQTWAELVATKPNWNITYLEA